MKSAIGQERQRVVLFRDIWTVPTKNFLSLASMILPIQLRTFCSRSSTKKITGTVKWFNPKKGFGFIIPDAGSEIGTEVFVHQSNIVSATGFRSLTDNLKVSFTYRTDQAGKMQAFEVTASDGSPVQVSSPKK